MQILHIYSDKKHHLLEKPVQNLIKALDFHGLSSKSCCIASKEALNDALKSHGKGIVHFHDSDALHQGLSSVRLKGNKAVFTAHFADEATNTMEHWFLNKAVANSQFVNDEVFAGKASVIFDGIDIEEFDAALRSTQAADLRQKFDIPQDVFIIGAIGPLVKENDFETAIKSLRNVVAKEMNAHLVIAGEGDEYKALLKTAEKLKVLDRVKIVQSQDYVSLLCLFDAYVVSSFNEGYLGTILGAMAASIPVIATKVGANPEMIVQGKTGYLVPCGFPERIDNVIMRWKANPQHTKDVGEAGRQFVEEEFSLPVMGQRYKAIYEKL